MDEIRKTEEEWRKELSPEEYEALREGATEPRFSGKYLQNDEEGVYRCRGCGAMLFTSKQKFDSSDGDPGLEGWPSFSDPAVAENIGTRPDDTYGMHRTEIFCKRCGSHLGHVFDDKVKGEAKKHYCVNSVCLSFEKGTP